MKVNKFMTLRLVVAMILLLGASSCSKKSSSSNTSRATGWDVDGKKASVKQQTGPGLIFVEGGTFTMGKVQDDVMHDWNLSLIHI